MIRIKEIINNKKEKLNNFFKNLNIYLFANEEDCLFLINSHYAKIKKVYSFDDFLFFEKSIFKDINEIGKIKTFSKIFIEEKKYFLIRKLDDKYKTWVFLDLYNTKNKSLKEAIQSSLTNVDLTYEKIFIDFSVLKSWGLFLPVMVFLTFISLLIVVSNFIGFINLNVVQSYINEILSGVKI